MAMTKAEKQRVDNLEKALRLARALRWPDYPVPQMMTVEEIRAELVDGGSKYGHPEKVAFGWQGNRYAAERGYGAIAEGMCSNGYNHGSGNCTTTQGKGQMYRTRMDALRAVRHDLTIKYAEILANVDAQISEASYD